MESTASVVHLGDCPTVFQFAVDVINRRPALLQELQQSSAASQSTQPSEVMGVHCMDETVDGDRSVPFELCKSSTGSESN